MTIIEFEGEIYDNGRSNSIKVSDGTSVNFN